MPNILPPSGNGIQEVNEGEEGQATKAYEGSVKQEESRTNKEDERLQKSKGGSQILPRGVNFH